MPKKHHFQCLPKQEMRFLGLPEASSGWGRLHLAFLLLGRLLISEDQRRQRREKPNKGTCGRGVGCSTPTWALRLPSQACQSQFRPVISQPFALVTQQAQKPFCVAAVCLANTMQSCAAELPSRCDDFKLLANYFGDQRLGAIVLLVFA